MPELDKATNRLTNAPTDKHQLGPNLAAIAEHVSVKNVLIDSGFVSEAAVVAGQNRPPLFPHAPTVRPSWTDCDRESRPEAVAVATRSAKMLRLNVVYPAKKLHLSENVALSN